MTSIETATPAERLFAAFQRCLPTRALSALMFRVAEWPNAGFQQRFIGWFLQHYPVNLAEAEFERPASYPHFNAFFTRALKTGARPQPDDTALLTSPVDGTVSQNGSIEQGSLLQAKGHDYTVEELLGDSDLAAEFDDGRFCTIYLAPHDYHRVHMPLAGRLRSWAYVPGRLFSVNPGTARALPRLFVRNERMVAIFDTDRGPLAVVMVGALFVGGIETVWNGRLTPPHRRGASKGFYQPMHALALERGAELGRFHMGSTVILLTARDTLDWLPQIASGQTVRLGEPLARLHPVNQSS